MDKNMVDVTVAHRVGRDWRRGKLFHNDGQNALLPSTVQTSYFFDKLVVRLLRLMHISQKSFLPSFLYDLPVGHDKPLHASLYQTGSFQDNANYDKFHHPALCAFLLISLIREGLGVSAEGHVVWLNDAETASLSPPFALFPSCHRRVSSVFSHLLFFKTPYLSLVVNGEMT